MVIRPATGADLDAIRSLAEDLNRFQSAWRVFPTREGLVEEVVGRYRRLLADEGARVLLAEDEGLPIGMACAEVVVPSRFSNERAVELSGVMVRADARGRGVGRALVVAAADFGKVRGVDRMVLHAFAANEEGLGFWVSLGFEPRVIQFTAPLSELRPEGSNPS